MSNTPANLWIATFAHWPQQWHTVDPLNLEKTDVPTTSRGTRMSAVNACTEGMEKSPTFKDALARG